MARDTGLSKEKTKDAETRVRKWQEDEEMHLPQFDVKRINELKGTIAYPPEGSSTRPKNKEEKQQAR